MKNIPSKKAISRAEELFNIKYPPSFKSQIHNINEIVQDIDLLYPGGQFLSSLQKSGGTLSIPDHLSFFKDTYDGILLAFNLASEPPEYRITAFGKDGPIHEWSSFTEWLEWCKRIIETIKQQKGRSNKAL